MKDSQFLGCSVHRCLILFVFSDLHESEDRWIEFESYFFLCFPVSVDETVDCCIFFVLCVFSSV